MKKWILYWWVQLLSVHLSVMDIPTELNRVKDIVYAASQQNNRVTSLDEESLKIREERFHIARRLNELRAANTSRQANQNELEKKIALMKKQSLVD
jgi:hypothetical protein